jgi:hypothetical protein
MWAFLDLVARLILLGGVALVFFWLRSIVHEPIRACVCCGSALAQNDLANCYRCLYPSAARENRENI